MKKRLFLPGLLLLPILLMAQQTAKLKPVSEIFEEGFKYLNGINKNYDPQKAVQLFREAAAKGDAAAMNALGNLYLNGYGGVEKNMNTAIQYYKQAGHAGYGAGYYNLAKLYKDNKDLEQDLPQSAIYAKTGADLGDNNCKKLLAYYHFKGFGIMQDYYKAFALYNELAQAGNVNAQYFVGLCYRNGYGTITNPDEAKKWLLMAARQGDYQATHELTAELNPENSNVNNPEIQQQVNKLKAYHEKLVAAKSNDISGEYRGFAIYYDFSGKFVHEVVPLSLILKQTHNGYTGTWLESDSLSVAVKGSFDNNNFNFDNDIKYTRRNYYSYRDAEEYQFKSARLAVNYISDSMYLTGNMQFYSISRREPGQPMYIVLGKKVQGSGSSSGVTLTLSPNPATTVIRATFNITNTTKVSFAIVDMDGKIINRQTNEALLPPGTYYRSINIQQLPQGTYGLQIMTGTGAAITKQFIKL